MNVGSSDMKPRTEEVSVNEKPNLIQIHWVFLILAAIVLVLSALMSVTAGQLVYLPFSNVPLPESCSSKIWLGIDCPACGMTRAFISISHGNIENAIRFNPASPLIYFFVVVQIPWQLYQIQRIKSGRPPVTHFWIYMLPAIFMTAMLIQWLLKLTL